jgi:lysozyme
MTQAVTTAMEMIKQFEGVRLTAYLCPAGRLTIGAGSTHHVTPGMTITKEDAERLLADEVEEVWRSLQSCVKVSLNDNQWAALISFTHNIGITRVRQSTLLKKLNSGNLAGAGEEFLRWKHAKGIVIQGLVRRREIEQEVFLDRKKHESARSIVK